MRQLIFLIFFAVFTQNLSAQEFADCATAKDICKKQVYHIESARGEGRDHNEAVDVPCFENGDVRGNAEMNSVWFHLKIKKTGSLTFAMTPHRFDDDLDFVMYRLIGGSCSDKIIVRCMASGDRDYIDSPCMGETGLRPSETDISEDAGCSDLNDNAWLAPMQVREGEEYALLVSNVTSEGVGFSIRFGGSCMLPCDEPKKPKEAKQNPTAPPTIPQRSPIVCFPQPPELPKLPPPTEIEKRPVFVKKTLEVSSPHLSIGLSDSEVVDGDVVSLWLNDKKVVNRVELKHEPQVFFVNLQPGDNYLTIHAEEFGQAPVNTTQVVVDDGEQKQVLKLVAMPGKEESLRVFYKK